MTDIELPNLVADPIYVFLHFIFSTTNSMIDSLRRIVLTVLARSDSIESKLRIRPEIELTHEMYRFALLSINAGSLSAQSYAADLHRNRYALFVVRYSKSCSVTRIYFYE